MPLLAIDRNRPDTVVLDLHHQLPPRRVGLLWHRDRHRIPPTESFTEVALAVGAELAREAEDEPATPLVAAPAPRPRPDNGRAARRSAVPDA
jgi:hypothetical protein